MKLKSSNSNNPVWKNVTIKMRIPESLKNVERLAHNLWWTWNNEAIELFKSMDPDLYRECGKNPVAMLGRMSYGSLNNLAANKEFLERANDVCAKFDKYMKVKPDTSRPSVAYFCMEYGLSNVLKIYSGGLGILAGDYIKQASDSNVDMCAVGFLYRYGYFDQSLAMDGQQIANYEAQDFENLPIEKVFDKDGKQQVVEVPFPNYTVYAYVWKVNVGRVTLYLLDTDNDMNSEFDRNITKTLYGGDWENRLKQEYLLGIGGVLMLKKLGIKKDIYHCNEGHAALCNVQRLVDYVQEGKLSSMRPLNSYVRLRCTRCILLFLQGMTISTKACLASTLVRILKNLVSHGTSLLAWDVQIPTITARSSACPLSFAIPVRKSMVSACCTAR